MCDVEVKIVAFVLKDTLKLTARSYRQDEIKVRSKNISLCGVFDLKFERIHLAQMFGLFMHNWFIWFI